MQSWYGKFQSSAVLKDCGQHVEPKAFDHTWSIVISGGGFSDDVTSMAVDTAAPVVRRHLDGTPQSPADYQDQAANTT